jgi:hypothetical protein
MEKILNALINEALFTGEMLCAGYTQIRKANYAKRGTYFQAFTSLSTGIERIGKLNLILSYAIDNKGNYPTNKYIKDSIGHDLIKIYNDVKKQNTKYGFKFQFLDNLDDKIYQDIIELLSRFGKGDRYSNIDLIVGSSNYDDPITVWYNKIDMYLYQRYVSKRKKAQIEQNAKVIHELVSPFTMVLHTAEDGTDINNVFDASLRTGINESISPYRQLIVFQIIRYFVESLHELQYTIMQNNLFEIPFFTDVFGVFINDDKFMIKRKTLEIV